jgi:hypothetical protein
MITGSKRFIQQCNALGEMISLLFSSFLLSIYHCQDFLPDLTVYMSKAAGVLKET